MSYLITSIYLSNSIDLSTCLSVSLSVCLSSCLSECPSIYIYFSISNHIYTIILKSKEHHTFFNIPNLWLVSWHIHSLSLLQDDQPFVPGNAEAVEDQQQEHQGPHERPRGADDGEEQRSQGTDLGAQVIRAGEKRGLPRKKNKSVVPSAGSLGATNIQSIYNL